MVCGLVVGGTRGGGVVERGLACGHLVNCKLRLKFVPALVFFRCLSAGFVETPDI